jgi:hypothetical protein
LLAINEEPSFRVSLAMRGVGDRSFWQVEQAAPLAQ